MNLATNWRCAPREVKVVAIVWTAMAAIGAASTVYQLLLFTSLSVKGIALLFIIETVLRAGFIAVILGSVMGLLRGRRLARSVLEVCSWMMLLYFGAIGATWMISAMADWPAFVLEAERAQSAAPAGVQLGFVGAVTVMLVGASAYVVRALRSSSTRLYVSGEKVGDGQS